MLGTLEKDVSYLNTLWCRQNFVFFKQRTDARPGHFPKPSILRFGDYSPVLLTAGTVEMTYAKAATRRSAMLRKPCGYTLYELLMTLTLVALIVGLGLPSFSGIAARNRMHVEINALFHAIHLARKESIMRKRVVSLCPSFDGLTCEPGRDWSAGWLMFENTDRDEPPRRDHDEPLLQGHVVAKDIRIMTNRRGFTLRATQKRATNGTFVFCDRAGRVVPVALVVSYTGRPRVTQETRRGEPYSCAD
jgi:type IV fimbrial biogenesis protein FimT